MKINSKKNEKIIHLLLKKYKLEDRTVYIVPDISIWAETHGLKEPSSRLAITPRRSNSNTRDLVIKELIDGNDIPSVISVFHFHPTQTDFKRLNNLPDFFIHLILHEIAHCLGIGNNKGEDYKSDQWALKELDKIDDRVMKEIHLDN